MNIQLAKACKAGSVEAKQREFAFTERDFRRVRQFLHEQAGISLSDTKQEMVYCRLSRRVRQLELGSFAQYLDYVSAHREEELGNFINALTTNLTAFFREKHHFDYLASQLVAEWSADPGKRRIRIWSAGCSTGKEPYSIAMVLKETLPQDREWDVRILATDLDTDVVARAKAGVYPRGRVAGIDHFRMKRWFLSGKGNQSDMVRVRPELQEMITFKQLNLLHDWPIHGPLDAIFCRNVLIYFNKKTQRALINRYADLLSENGVLFIGHSETLYEVSNRFSSLGNTIYRKLR